MRDFSFGIFLRLLIFPFLLSVLLAQPLLGDRVKSALKQLKKGSLEKTRTLLNKSLAKEKINPGAKYVYSLFYLKADNKSSNLDSGYTFILEAIDDYKTVDEKKKKRLSKLGITDSTLNAQKEYIEELAFAGASYTDQEESYQNFILRFNSAKLIAEAIRRRDQKAYQKAESLNTSKSYQDFLQKYPQSLLASRARENYDLRLFQESTGAGTLLGYIDFLRENPGSPYRSRAEEKVFKIVTFLNKLEDYKGFIESFPDNKFVSEAWTYLFFHHVENRRISEFLSKYPSSPYTAQAEVYKIRQDSIYYVFYENRRFGFISESGGQLSKERYEGVPDNYLCSGVKEEYLIYSKDTLLGAVDKTGNEILPPKFNEIVKIGTATLRVKEGQVYALYLMNGKKASREEFEDIQRLNDAFVKVKFNGQWGLRGLNGCEVLDPVYEEINYVEKDFYLIKKDGKYALVKGQELKTFAEMGKAILNFKYDSYEEVDGDFLEIKNNGRSGVVDGSHNFIIKPVYSALSFNKTAWIAKGDAGVEIFDLKGKLLNQNTYNQVIPGAGVYSVKQGGKWGILDREGKMLVPADNDSILSIGDKIIIAYKEKKALGLFNLSHVVALPEHTKLEILSTTSSKDSVKTQYLSLTGPDDKVSIYGKNGKVFLKPVFDKIIVVTENIFIVEQKGKVGIVDSLGKSILPAKYDDIGNYSNGYLSLLKSSKFGIYNPTTKLLIQPKFDATIKVFDPTNKLFLAMDDKAYAFIDAKGNAISDFRFKEASRWKGDTVLVKEEDKYLLYSLKAKKEVSDKFESVKFIRDDQVERLAMVRKDDKYGIISNRKGQVINATYNDITNLGTVESPFYMAEHQVEEADFFVVLYINHFGKTVMSQAYKSAEYDKLLCQE